LSVLGCAAFAPLAHSFNVLTPSDFIIAIDADFVVPASSTPASGNEDVGNAIDGIGTNKYLNFGRENSGFIVTPGSSTIQNLRLNTANDAEARDPATYILQGTNVAIATPDHGTGDEIDYMWQTIGSGS